MTVSPLLESTARIGHDGAVTDPTPGPDWWQAADGRWYPPDLKPTHRLVRDARGATVLVGPGPGPVVGEPSPSPSRSAHDEVGGAIDSHAELYLGRPAGTQNRPAAWLALFGAVVMAAGGLLPWATRTVAVGGTEPYGWRDASGELSGGLYVVLLAVTVMTVSVRCMAGSYSREWRAALVGLAATGFIVAAVESARVLAAIDEVNSLTRGSVSLSLGPGLGLVALGAIIVLVGAGAYRVGSPH